MVWYGMVWYGMVWYGNGMAMVQKYKENDYFEPELAKSKQKCEKKIII